MLYAQALRLLPMPSISGCGSRPPLSPESLSDPEPPAVRVPLPDDLEQWLAEIEKSPARATRVPTSARRAFRNRARKPAALDRRPRVITRRLAIVAAGLILLLGALALA